MSRFNGLYPASSELQLESLESFAWNLVDNVVGNHGTGDHKLSDVCINSLNKITKYRSELRMNRQFFPKFSF